MKNNQSNFNEHEVLHELKHFLPAQAPLKDFIHHNTLHSFQNLKFYDALHQAAKIFGFKTTLSLNDYRNLHKKGRIDTEVLERIIEAKKGKAELELWKNKLFKKQFDYQIDSRIGKLKANWKNNYKIDMDALVHPLLFRIVCSYLDQGIAIWNFPIEHKGFLSSIRELERMSYSSIFNSKRVKDLLLDNNCSIEHLLEILVGDETLYAQYLYDQQFAHQGWSGMVSFIEDNPNALLDTKKITLHDFIVFELLLEINALDSQYGNNWKPLKDNLKERPTPLFAPVENTELNEVIMLWQDVYEWTYYDQVLAGVQLGYDNKAPKKAKSFQALFCIDDRECSIRRYVEQNDINCETFGTPGFFGVEFFYQPKNGKFHTKLCPAPVTPKYLIKEINTRGNKEKDVHYSKKSHSLFQGWIISQTLGFSSAFKLAVNIFKPTMSPATTSSFKHMDKFSQLTIENKNINQREGDLQIGFTVDEMVVRVQNLLNSIGLIENFAPLVYLVGHGASSINNTHYAGYDCGACSGRPGSVNARVMSFMANHKKVREILANKGLVIPDTTQFVGALHDTTRDEMEFYDEDLLNETNKMLHEQNKKTFEKSLDENAKERSRRFILTNTKDSAKKVHEAVKLRSVSLFEPRPELNHATNALCIIGQRDLTKYLFLDRRSFLNSYDYKIDLDGTFLTNILKPIGPVCGGINLEYYFSRVDNQKLGAGTKLPHNVMGLIGVANGIDGDLRPGLPSQMIEVHDPIRMLVIVEHYPEIVLKAISQAPETYEWYNNEWMHLVSVNPVTRKLQVFENGQFVPYNPLITKLELAPNLNHLVESTEENFPVFLFNN
ncbi:MAG: YbcC family protein [Candidatus Methylacidiphilales bacterium]